MCLEVVSVLSLPYASKVNVWHRYMMKHSPFPYVKPGLGFLDHLAQARGPGTKSQRPHRTIERAPTFPPSVLPEQLALDGFARAVVRGPTARGYGAQSLQLSRRVQDHGPRIMSPVLWRLAL